MKRSKRGNYQKVVALVLIAIVIISAVGFVANGWQPIINSGADSGDAGNNNGDVANKNENADEIPVVGEPKYYSYLTGLETTEELSRQLPIAFLTDPGLPLYGASYALVAIEFPTEGESRLVLYAENATSLGKIGPLLPTRDYISGILSHFGGTLLTMGNDDIVDYVAKEFSGSVIDLSKISGHHYTEVKNAFTNGDLIRAAITSGGGTTELTHTQRLPFSFIEIDSNELFFGNEANKITIPYPDGKSTELTYDAELGKYIYSKNGVQKVDMLTASNISFNNAFVLFADSVTHETSGGSELILKPTGSGSGYYMTGGTYVSIKWVCDGDSLTLYDQNDNKLTVNRGTSYIAFMKSTEKNQLSFS